MVQAFIVINIAIAVLIVYLGLTNSRRFLFACAFLLPLQGLAIDLGVLLNWSKLVLPIALLLHVLRARRPFSSLARLPGRYWYFLFLAYAVIVTLINIVLGTHADAIKLVAALGAGIAQSKYRLHVQLATTILSWGGIIAAALFTRDEHDADGAVKGLIAGGVFNAVFGIFGNIAERLHLPWIGTVVAAQTEGMSSFNTAGRLAGLAGEPKHAAAGFVFALLFLFWVPKGVHSEQRPQRVWVKASILILALLLTLSTSGMVAGAVALLFNLLAAKKQSVAIFVTLGVTLLSFVLLLGSGLFYDVLQYRLVEKVSDPGRFEYKDAAFWKAAFDHPEGLILGSGAGGGDLKLVSYLDQFYIQKGISPGYLLDEMLGDFGIIGVGLVGCFVWKVLAYLRRSPDKSLFRLILSGVFVSLLVPRFSIWGFVFVASSLVVAARSKSTQRA